MSARRLRWFLLYTVLALSVVLCFIFVPWSPVTYIAQTAYMYHKYHSMSDDTNTCGEETSKPYLEALCNTWIVDVHKMFCVADFEAHAREVLDRNAWNYYSSGANHEQTLKDNVEGFSRYRLRPRVLRDVSKLDTKVSLFGEEVAFPICVSPTAMHCMAHPEGEAAIARACGNLGTCMTLSMWSTTSMEDVAMANGSGLRWCQVNVLKDRGMTRYLIQRAEKAGYKAIVVTVDNPTKGMRLTDARNHFNLPSHLCLANFTNPRVQSSLVTKDGDSGLHQHNMASIDLRVMFSTASGNETIIDAALTWDDIDWVCSVTKLPVLLKGILTAEDAVEAMKHNICGIIVSNHGARQLDGVPATVSLFVSAGYLSLMEHPSTQIDVLCEVVEAVRGRVEVFMDGGVRQGTDVLKALAMGARAVFVGRPVLWGLAYKGSDGVEQVLQILRDEFRVAMMLSGCSKISDIKPELVVHESYYKSKL